MKRTTPLLLVFDGECPMCVALTRLYLLLGWVPAERRVALQDVDPELLAALTAAGIRNEMAVVEPASRRILTGVPGLFWLLRETWARPIVWVLDRPVLRSVCDVAYRFIGFNRRFFSTPRPRGFQCACEPDERVSYNLSLVVLALVLAFAAVTSYDRAWGPLPVETFTERRLQFGRALLVLLVLRIALTAPPALRLRALGHASMGIFYGAFLLALATLPVRWIPAGHVEVYLSAAGILAGLWLLRFLGRRFRYIGLARPALRAGIVATLTLLALGLRGVVALL